MGGARATALDSSLRTVTLAGGEASCRRRSARPGRSHSCHSPGGLVLGCRLAGDSPGRPGAGPRRPAQATTRLLGQVSTLSPFD